MEDAPRRKRPECRQRKAGSPVCCAGPIFSMGDKNEQEAIAAALADDGYVAYLPHTATGSISVTC